MSDTTTKKDSPNPGGDYEKEMFQAADEAFELGLEGSAVADINFYHTVKSSLENYGVSKEQAIILLQIAVKADLNHRILYKHLEILGAALSAAEEDFELLLTGLTRYIQYVEGVTGIKLPPLEAFLTIPSR